MEDNQDNLQDIEKIEVPAEAVAPQDMKTFADLGVAPELLKAI